MSILLRYKSVLYTVIIHIFVFVFIFVLIRTVRGTYRLVYKAWIDIYRDTYVRYVYVQKYINPICYTSMVCTIGSTTTKQTPLNIVTLLNTSYTLFLHIQLFCKNVEQVYIFVGKVMYEIV